MERRFTTPVHVGAITIGGDAPVRVQSMTTTPTLDVEASAAQAAALAKAGAELVRLTAQGVAHAAALGKVKERLKEMGVDVPLVADIHFNPAAAFEAALHVDKVRINPGNFADPGRTFRKMEFTDAEYNTELQRLEDKLVPFLRLCREHGVALRIGVNHGSLSDRIMSRYGDGTAGMVESAMEFLRICRKHDFGDVVVSIKASDVPTMTATVRVLVAAMDAEGMHYPLHLGVTEAGNALEGRIKSAVGIGTLLTDGIGDTIRVSLSEDPCAEIPVARTLLDHIAANNAASPMATAMEMPSARPHKPEILTVGAGMEAYNVVRATSGNRINSARRQIKHFKATQPDKPIAVVLGYNGTDPQADIVAAAVDLGYLLLEGNLGALALDISSLGTEENLNVARTIVQAAGLDRFKAEIVACPGCGRTLFDLPAALECVKDACSHLKHLKIAVMGCIVNGPGEMAGADYGYVGAAAGNVSIYRGIEPVVRNVPQAEAIGRLVDLIKADGQWLDPQS